MKRLPLLFAVLALLFLAAPALGDKIFLKNGRSFEGKVVRETSTHVFFKIKGLGEQQFKKSEVLKIEKGESAYDEFEKKRSALKKDDAEGHYELGLWCEENSLRKEARKAYRAAMDADSDHEGAREKLGFVRYEGEWMKKEKRAEILAGIAKREGEILAALSLAAVVKDEAARFQIAPPRDWESEAEAGASMKFSGPTLGKMPLTVVIAKFDPEDSLDEFADSVESDLKDEYEDLRSLGDPEAGKLAGNAARLIGFGYSRDDVAPETLEVETRALVMTCAAGSYVLSLECRLGYFDRLRPFFGRLAGSIEILDKALDVDQKEDGFGLAFPDETYSKTEGIPFSFQGQKIDMPDGTVILGTSSNPLVRIIFMPGKKGDGKTDTTSLGTVRDSLLSFFPAPMPNFFTFVSGSEKSVTISGQEGLTGKFNILGGGMATGTWAVVMKGDRYHRCLFLNFMNRMGDRYVRQDFQKFLAGIKLY